MGLANTIPHAGKCGIVWRTSRNACRSDYYPDHVLDRRNRVVVSIPYAFWIWGRQFVTLSL